MAEEEFLSEPGKPVRKVYFNPELLQNIKATWFIDITPTEKQSGDLDRVLLIQNIGDAATIFGMQSLNMEYLKERFAILCKEDPSKFFVQGQPAMPMGEEGQEMPGQLGGKIGQQVAQGVQAPSLNQMVK